MSKVKENPLGKVGLWQEGVLGSQGPSSQGRFSDTLTLKTSGEILISLKPACAGPVTGLELLYITSPTVLESSSTQAGH